MKSDGGELTGKVMVISGAAGGIGGATARLAAERGVRVVVLDVRDEEGARLVSELAGTGHEYRHLDVADASAWEEMFRDVAQRLGGVDIVHLNAGRLAAPTEEAANSDAFDWMTGPGVRSVIDVNVMGVVLGLLAAVPYIQSRGGGKILITSSTAGLDPYEKDPVYSLTKSGLIAFARSVAPALDRRGITAMVLCPGSTDTSFFPDKWKRVEGGTVVSVSSNRPLQSPDLVAEAALVALLTGKSGEVWMALPGENPYVHKF
jgi:3alpha(or 20beta)-hydroxysteroid dehydrogenase